MTNLLISIALFIVLLWPKRLNTSFKPKHKMKSPIEIITLTNSNGVEVSILTLGGIVSNILLPNKNGLPTDIVLGFDDPVMYKQDHPYFGGIIGRVANRVANGKITLAGKIFNLSINNDSNHLHGGNRGFDKVIWEIKERDQTPNSYVVLHYLSQDGEEGYPGNLDVSVRYELTQQNELIITYSAKTDMLTVVNLTNHSYFNLSGIPNSDILSHKLTTNAAYILQLDAKSIPTGEKIPVQNTVFDFREAKELGKDIINNNDQLKIGMGYDHYFILHYKEPDSLHFAATLLDPGSRRT